MPSVNRQKNYEALRKAGFNSSDANKFKDYSTEYIIKLVDLQRRFNAAKAKELEKLGIKK